MQSTERNAGASAVINPLKEERSNGEVISVTALCRLQEIQVVGVLRENGFLERSADRVKGHCKKKATRRTASSYTSGHQELSPFCSHKFLVRDAVPANTSQEATEKARQPSVLKHREDPGVIDTGTCGGKISQEDTFAEHTRHGPGRWSQSQRCCPSFAWMRCISVRRIVPMKASTYGRCKEFPIAIAQCQWTKCIR